MKLIVTLCICAMAMTAAAQQPAAKQKKVLTPAQQQFQQRWRAYMAKRTELQARAKQLFDAEMAREKSSPCKDVTDTRDENACLSKQSDVSDKSLTDYEAAIHELLAAVPDDGTPMRGPSGMALTPAQSAAEFDGVEKAWREYRGKACQAARDQMGGGTAAPSAEMRCEVNLDHSHMRELDSIYWLALHK